MNSATKIKTLFYTNNVWGLFLGGRYGRSLPFDAGVVGELEGGVEELGLGEVDVVVLDQKGENDRAPNGDLLAARGQVVL